MAQGSKAYRTHALRESKDDKILVKEVVAVKVEAEALEQLAAKNAKQPFRLAGCFMMLTSSQTL